jgi:hypothetical protein
MDLSKIDFDTWMEWGLQRGFVGPPVCATHDGIPMSKAEEQQTEEFDDVCIHVIRPYRSQEERKAVEANHPATKFRNPLVS